MLTRFRSCVFAPQALAQSVESILDSLISAELEMNNLPYDNVNDLIKGLQVWR